MKTIATWLGLTVLLAGVEVRGDEMRPRGVPTDNTVPVAHEKRIAALRSMHVMVPVMIPISRTVAIGKYEVTFDEYDQFAAKTGRKFPSDKGWGRDKRPVINVSWEDAVAYTEWLSRETGKRYRLPTEREWDTACDVRYHYCGSNNINAVAWYDKNSGYKSHPVGERQPNSDGFYDMSGNVQEWTADTFTWSVEPWGPKKSYRVIRGGSWGSLRSQGQAGDRRGQATDEGNHSVGFRLAQDLGDTAQTDKFNDERQATAEKARPEAFEKRIAELKARPLIDPVMIPIERTFAIGKYEVTFDEYDQFAAKTDRPLPNDSGFGRGKRPVININGDDAEAYTKWLSEKTGKRYRLPTEREWGLACNIQQTTFCGSNDINAVAWYEDNSGGKTHAVGEKQPNQRGLYDMSGNVWEWTADRWKNDKRMRMYRGGSWNSEPEFVRSDFRYGTSGGVQSYALGFRLAQDL